jgi:hypothetical protein
VKTSAPARDPAKEPAASQAAFDVRYTPVLIEHATRVFRDYRFKRYGALLIAACVLNALVMAFLVWLRADTSLARLLLVFVVAVGPVWLLYEYFVAPSRFAIRLKRALPDSARVSFAKQSISFAFDDQKVTVPWRDIKDVVEADTLFLLVISPFTFLLLPSAGIPPAASRALHARSRPGEA